MQCKWSTRKMAEATGMSASTVSRIWRAFGVKPHRMETYKLSTDSLFIEKVRDIVGLYLFPSERAVVLCVDEKPQIQANPFCPWAQVYQNPVHMTTGDIEPPLCLQP
ncbi:MAG: hypothetical protein F4065_11045 [Rhodothermaceae bacterium]|nr:hypothetical protein [Rhodothermaceae bacterium]MYJ50928.1 hypothetical protein [Rhodothermaceae bacterium]